MKKHRLALCAASLVACLAAASGTSFAGTRDLAREEANRKLVLTFYEQVFVRHDVAAASDLLADDYIQHNPMVPNGKAAFVNVFTGFFKANPDARGVTVRSATDGDLVYLHNHSTINARERAEARGRAIVDIFRVRDGRIVEHWDVIQAIPETSANGNTMF